MSVNKSAKKTILPGFFSSPLSDELPFEEILEDGLIIYSDGSLGQGYEIFPLYLDSMQDEAIDALETQLSGTFAMLDGRTDITCQFVWEKTASSEIVERSLKTVTSADAALRKLYEKRAEFWREKLRQGTGEKGSTEGAIYDMRCMMFLRQTFNRKYKVPVLGISMTGSAAEISKEHRILATRARSEFGRIVKSLEALKPKKMTGDETFDSIYRAIFGPGIKGKYDRLAAPARNYLSGRDVEMERKYGYISIGDGGRNVATLSMHSLPAISWMRMMSYLSCLDCPARIVQYITPVDTSSTKRMMELKLRRAVNYGSIYSAKSRMIVEEIEQVAADLENGSRLVDTELYVTVEGSSARVLGENVQKAKGKGLEADITLVDEHIALWPCWLASIPGYGRAYMTDRNHKVKTENAINMSPLLLGGRPADAAGTFLMKGPCSSLTSWDMFSPALAAHHGLIFGATGAGKSFFTSLMALSAMAHNPLIFIVDKGGSYRRLVEMLGGKYVEIASGETAINPFEIPEKTTKENIKTYARLWGNILRVMCAEEGKSVDAYQNVIIERCVLQMETKALNDERLTTSTVYEILDTHRLYEPEKEAHLSEPQNRLCTLLGRWTHIGTKGKGWHCQLLDCPATNVNIQDAQVVAIDMNGIEQYKEILSVVFLVISDMIRRRAQSEPGRRKLVIFDEVWSVMRTREGALFLEELFRTMRKYNAGVWAISQDINDFAESEVRNAIMSNVYQKVIMRQSSDTSYAAIQKHLGLNDAEMWLLGQLRQNKGEFSELLLSTAGSGDTAVKVGIYPSPEELWMATTDASDVALFNSLVKSGCSPMDAVFRLARDYPMGANSTK